MYLNYAESNTTVEDSSAKSSKSGYFLSKVVSHGRELYSKTHDLYIDIIETGLKDLKTCDNSPSASKLIELIIDWWIILAVKSVNVERPSFNESPRTKFKSKSLISKERLLKMQEYLFKFQLKKNESFINKNVDVLVENKMHGQKKLFGRNQYGWRGKKAVIISLIAFIFLFLAYFGTKFVLEILLN